MKVEGCTAIVTGGNRGIGQGFVEALLEAGANHVYIGARTPDNAVELVNKNPDRLSVVELDVTNADQVQAAAAACKDVNLLVNNAGVFQMQTLMGAPDMSSMRAEMEANYFGLVSMCRSFAPVIESNGGGGIVNVLSVGGIIAVPDMGGYSPSKYAARAASDCMRIELAPKGIHVTALIVGSVKTRMAAHVQSVDQALPIDIGKSGIYAIENQLDEHDTDPHAVSMRAFIARDPAGVKATMSRRFK